MDPMKTIVALPGEGIGLEVVDATCELLMGTGLPLKILTPPQGCARCREETKRAAREADGVLFGAAGPSTSPVVSWLRWEMSRVGRRAADPLLSRGCARRWPIPRASTTSSCARTARASTRAARATWPISSRLMPDLSDRTGRTLKDYGTEGRFAVKVVTPRGAERIARFACDLAQQAQGAGQARQDHAA